LYVDKNLCSGFQVLDPPLTVPWLWYLVS
jgi:hypothetical protein